MRYRVSLGTKVRICRASDESGQWDDYTTQKQVEFPACESVGDGSYVFRQGAWLMLVRASKVERIISFRKGKVTPCES